MSFYLVAIYELRCKGRNNSSNQAKIFSQNTLLLHKRTNLCNKKGLFFTFDCSIVQKQAFFFNPPYWLFFSPDGRG